MRLFACLFCVLSLGGWSAGAWGAVANVEEADGSPSCYPWKLLVPNGSLTDNSDATCSLLATTTDLTLANLDLAGTGPDLRLSPTSGDVFHLGAEFASGSGSIAFFSNLTDSKIYWLVDNAHQFYFPDVTGLDCSTKGNAGKLTVSAGRKLYCADDETAGAGAGDITEVTAGSGLTGGGTTGAVTLTVGAGTGITVNADDVALTVPVVVSSGGTGATSLTDGGILLGSGTGAITPLGVATNGQVPIGDGTTDPVLATITGTSNQVTVTNGAGTITLSTPQDIATTSSPTFVNLALTGTGPDLTLNPSSGDAWHLGAEAGANGGTIFLSNTTDAKTVLQIDGLDNLYFNQLISCTGGLQTTSEGRVTCRTYTQQKCASIENLVAADDNLLLFIAPIGLTVQRVSCRTASFTTQPTLSFEDGSGNAMTGSPSCNAVETQVWSAVTSGGAVSANESIRVDVTNTPAPTTGTLAVLCFEYTQ